MGQGTRDLSPGPLREQDRVPGKSNQVSGGVSPSKGVGGLQGILVAQLPVPQEDSPPGSEQGVLGA